MDKNEQMKILNYVPMYSNGILW